MLGHVEIVYALAISTLSSSRSFVLNVIDPKLRTKRRGYAYGLNFLSIKYTTPNKIQNNGYDKIKRIKAFVRDYLMISLHIGDSEGVEKYKRSENK